MFSDKDHSDAESFKDAMDGFNSLNFGTVTDIGQEVGETSE